MFGLRIAPYMHRMCHYMYVVYSGHQTNPPSNSAHSFKNPSKHKHQTCNGNILTHISRFTIRFIDNKLQENTLTHSVDYRPDFVRKMPLRHALCVHCLCVSMKLIRNLFNQY